MAEWLGEFLGRAQGHLVIGATVTAELVHREDWHRISFVLKSMRLKYMRSAQEATPDIVVLAVPHGEGKNYLDAISRIFNVYEV